MFINKARAKMVSGYHVLKNNARRILKRAPKMKFFYGSYYKHCPVVENRILFESFHGSTISDSPFYREKMRTNMRFIIVQIHRTMRHTRNLLKQIIFR